MEADDSHDAFGEDLEEKLTCWVCFELMDEPLTLPCSHSFCKDCAVKVYKKDAICPFCRRPFGLPFPAINEELRALVVRIRKHLNKPGNEDPVDADGFVQDSLLLSLPDEVLVSMFMFLPYQELCRIARTSKDVDRVSSDGWLWRSVCSQHFPFLVSEDGDWKAAFRRRVLVKRGWDGGKAGDFKVTTMRGHTNYIETFDLYKHSLATGAADNAIKLWKVTGTAPVHTLEGHTGGVNALKFNEVHLVSGSADNSARIWDTTIGVCTHTLAHQGAVNEIAFDSTIVATASADRNVRIFDVRTGQNVHTLAGHAGPVSHVQLGANGRVVSSDPQSTRVWDLRADQKSLHSQNVSSAFIETLGDHVIIVGSDTSVRSMNLQNGSIKYTAHHAHNGVPTCVRADSKRVVVGTRHGGVYIINPETGQNSAIISAAHAGGVHGLQFDDGKLVTGGADNSVKVWNMANFASPMYALVGGSLQARSNNPAHPARPGCSGVIYDDTKVIAVFNALMRVYNFEGAGAQ
eukprot:TRINITY_DN13553_c0_g1_i1.p1 TRINITY_DN13553_c0_g1~~TRINITY_DN13553_c0_g1_i1.p1  ORF type:complete len:518 (+),score=90.16 TRINITY_DN13553_c0_g1_i1:67-1620(+)